MKDEESLFAEVLRCGSAAERAAALDRGCAGDSALRRRVESLVAAHDKAEGILDVTPPGITVPGVDTAPAAEPVGTSIGPYKLLELIGEGGMGAVYMAEQLRPVRRKVALKVIKPGMDSGQVIARFEAERQALTMMDHPNIARVLDAGTTDAGGPYFVMELVKGIPVTDYCDRARLPMRGRLELFVQICRAVQHAHQKGVIHRDLKPGNVLVTLHDERPVPKVIDFGIAKATAGQLTERTLFTNFAQLLGTPLYMSPEQAQFSGLDVDTRSDVYSLGVLLYELLTGTTPFDKRRLGEAAHDEMRRIIREEDPPRPSTRLGTLGARLTAVSADRHTEPGKLGRLVRGELDWIVMKAMEKERARRYETAIGLARDVERYLRDEPVAACPPSTLYRLRKFARRNKRAVGAASSAALLVLLLILTLAASNAGIRREQARTEAALALAERRGGEIRDGLERLKAANALFDRGRWYHFERRWDDSNAALTKAIELRPDHVSLWTWRGDQYAHLGLWDLAASDLAREVELREPDAALRWFQHALLRRAVGDDEGCRRAARRMRERFGGTLNPMFAHEVMRTQCLAPGPFAGGDGREAARLVELAVEIAARQPWSPYALFVLGTAHHRAGEHERAARRLEEALGLGDWMVRLLAQPVLAMTYHRLGRPAEAHRALADAAATLDRWTAARYAAGGGDLATGRGADPAWPVSWWDWLEMDLRCREARLLIEGAAPPADPRVRALHRSLMGLRRPEDAAPEYAAALDLGPPDARDPQVRLEAAYARGYVHIQRGEWAAAAGELVEATELRPDDVNLWRFRALAHIAAGDAARHRLACAAMLGSFGDTGDPATACSVVHSVVVGGGAVDDPARLLRLADVAGGVWHYGGWARGAALYRAGRYEDAVRCFESAARTFRPRAWEWCFLAMSHHRLGRPAEARRCLAEAARWIEQAGRHEGDDLTATLPAWGDWHEGPVYRLLLLEAEQLLNGGREGGPPTHPATRAVGGPPGGAPAGMTAPPR